MKTEKGIIFNADMVNAILAGRKTQTRRVIEETWRVGDRLFVKEAIMHGGYEGAPLTYCADGQHSKYEYPAHIFRKRHYRSAYHMPKWLSRITLEITGIKVERLSSISENDAIAEGCYTNQEYYDLAGDEDVWPCPSCRGYQVHAALGQNYGVTEVDCNSCEEASQRFKHLWNSIYKNDPVKSWKADPFVWRLTFKVTKDQ